MRRVSSRQRLVSWDSFDANAPTVSEGDEEEVSSYGSSSSQEQCDMPPSLPKKRERRSKKCSSPPDFSTIIITPSPSIDEEENYERRYQNIEDLPQDTLLYVYSFLDLPSLRRLMATNKKTRQLLTDKYSHCIWLQQCHQIWGDSFCFNGRHHHKLVDDLNLPTAVDTFQTHNMNLPLLLSMAPASSPTQVDLSKFPTEGSRRWRTSPMISYRDDQNRLCVQFTGTVGTGDRCIRGDRPLPRPLRRQMIPLKWACLSSAEDRRQNMVGSAIDFYQTPSLFDLLCRGAKAVASGNSSVPWKPFVVPFVTKQDDLTINCTPRFVSYYEVTIVNPEDTPPPATSSTSSTPHVASTETSDCVAIGVACRAFHLHSRMPGWDNMSFGYHGDDGGIFHASGGMVKRFGPSFGVGDTVGCGIDYITKGIFFTLNGKWLGYGWTNVKADLLQCDMYPVVGIDTNAPIRCNFGNKANEPFMFDLASFICKHNHMIQEEYVWTRNTNNTKNSAPGVTKTHSSQHHHPYNLRKRHSGRIHS